MNCLDFRRYCLIEPGSHDPRLYLHLYHCPACRAYRKRVLTAEHELKTVMSVPVPEGLDSRIVFDNEMQTGSASYGFRWQMFAAGVVLAIALGAGLATYSVQHNVVPALAMHIADDPLHMTPAQPDADRRLGMVMRHLGAAWVGRSLPITHAKVCLVKERAAAHLVVTGEQGPVTVFLIPNFSASLKETAAVDGQVATVRKLAQGSVALFGYPGENLDTVAAQFSASVRWLDNLAQQSEKIVVAGN